MKSGGLFGVDDVPWFNGGLFQTIAVPRLDILDVTELRNAAEKNWSAIDVSIFGTLFERGLDPAKRSQLGAHYTDPATIERIIDPVLRRPLLREWATAREAIAALLQKSKKRDDKAWRDAAALHIGFLQRLAAYRVLDPACGSGNFLYLALKCLKDVEHLVNTEAEVLGLERQVELFTGPANVLGIELNEYAAELARVTVWIGELQWRLDHGYPFKTNPVLEPLDHIECRDALLVFDSSGSGSFSGSDGGAGGATDGGSQVPGDLHIATTGHSARPATAALATDAGSALAGSAVVGPNLGVDLVVASVVVPIRTASEAPWPRADAVVGNPPFLGGSKKRRELGDDYFEALASVFGGRVPAGADLVCYWFDKACVQIESGELTTAGLVSTNSIRGGSNRRVLESITKTTRIFDAWSDEPWVNDGAAVRVSLVCFGQSEPSALNGLPVSVIHADLTGKDAGQSVDMSQAVRLPANAGAVFEGLRKDGALDIDGKTARAWLRLPNPNGRSNADVLFPLINGIDVTRRARDGWVIDTGESMTEAQASLYETPFAHIVTDVKSARLLNNDRIRRTFWWRFGRNGASLRAALLPIPRYVNTPRVAKHRLFVWQSKLSIPDTATVAIARADNTTFGILHSRFHELWSLRMGTWLGAGNDPRYTPTTCFETFPFPAGLTPADTAHPQTEAVPGSPHGALIPAQLPTPALQAAATRIAEAAARLSALREAWLNPPEWTERVPEVVPLGMDFSPYPDRTVPRAGLSATDAKALSQRTLTNLYNQRPAWLAMAHETLDAAVAAAYGWADVTPKTPDDELLARLLALNLERAGAADKSAPM
jgi:hypothetical protein